MKEKFQICIESFHIGDKGNQNNVSTNLNSFSCFWWSLGAIGPNVVVVNFYILVLVIVTSFNSESWLYEGEFCYLYRKYAHW